LSTKQGFSPASISLLFDHKEHDIHIEKLVGQRTVVYSRNEIPLLFNPEGAKANTTLFPSCYFMFQQMALEEKDEGVLKIYLKPGVESFIFNGADLMWPGIFAMSRD